jgi:hypothetical protein
MGKVIFVALIIGAILIQMKFHHPRQPMEGGTDVVPPLSGQETEHASGLKVDRAVVVSAPRPRRQSGSVVPDEIARLSKLAQKDSQPGAAMTVPQGVPAGGVRPAVLPNVAAVNRLSDFYKSELGLDEEQIRQMGQYNQYMSQKYFALLGQNLPPEQTAEGLRSLNAEKIEIYNTVLGSDKAAALLQFETQLKNEALAKRAPAKAIH